VAVLEVGLDGLHGFFLFGARHGGSDDWETRVVSGFRDFGIKG
jgi:hypothetical protein